MYGVRCYNDIGHVLISSDLYGMHYAGDAAYQGVVATLSPRAAMQRSGGVIYTSGNLVMRYTFTTSGVPLVFIKPTLGVFYSVLTHKQDGTKWTFDIIQGGDTLLPPRVLVFTTANVLPAPTDTDFGIATWMPDGSKAFDSRMGPLAITSGGLIAPPSSPADGGNPPDGWRFVDMGEGQDAWPPLDWNFNSNGTYHSEALNRTTEIGDMMFCAPSLAQSCWIRRIHHYWYDKEYDGRQDHNVYRQWWVFYRSAFRIRADVGGPRFDAGWLAYANGYSEMLDYEDSWFGGGGDYFDSGSPPFVQKTINLFANAFMIADASKY